MATQNNINMDERTQAKLNMRRAPRTLARIYRHQANPHPLSTEFTPCRDAIQHLDQPVVTAEIKLICQGSKSLNGGATMTQIIETRIQGNEVPNVNLTIQMLKGMVDVLDQHDAECQIAERDTQRAEALAVICRIAESHPIAEAKPVPVRCRPAPSRLSLPAVVFPGPEQGPAIDFSLDDEFVSDHVSEHTAIMVPQNELEGIFSIVEHLGEGIRPEIFKVNGTRIQTNGAGLTNLEKIIYYEAGQTAQGAAVLPHEDRSRRPWYLYAGGIRHKFNTTREQAESLAHSFKVLDTTSTMAMQFAKWIEKSGVEKAVDYFLNMASELLAVAPDDEPLDLIAYEESDDEIDADHPAEIETIQADAYHLLDDPRDAEDYPTWESLQPASFRFELSRVRTLKTLDDLKTWAKSQYGKPIDTFTKPQTQVLWDTYKRRKAALTPPLGAFAKKVIKRLSEPDVNIRRAKYWLYNSAPAKLNPTELANAWQVIKAKEAAIQDGV